MTENPNHGGQGTAMVFAAGLGTRLRPLTDTKPKALVEVAGKPLLWHVLHRLKAAGYGKVVVNVHHFADQIEAYLSENQDLGLDVSISDERRELLDTGGGIFHAKSLLLGGVVSRFDADFHAPDDGNTPALCASDLTFGCPATASQATPTLGNGDSASLCAANLPAHSHGDAASRNVAPGHFLVHNVDILSDLDLAWVDAEATESLDSQAALACVVVSERQTKRYFLFDGEMRLCGWTNVETGEVRSPYGHIDPDDCRKLAFAGIHLMSNRIFEAFEEGGFSGAFSITDFYIKVCARHRIVGICPERLRLIDVGKLASLPEAEAFLAERGGSC